MSPIRCWLTTLSSKIEDAIAGLGITACDSQIYEKFLASSINRQPQSYIGFQYSTREELKGLEFLGAAIMFGGGAVKNMYGGYTHVRQGQKNMLWLTGQRKVANQKQPAWEVLDVLSLPEYDQQLNNKIYYLGWGGRCRTDNGLSNADVIAIAVMERK